MQKLLDTWSNETPFSAQGLTDNDKSDAAKSFVLLEDNLKPLAVSLPWSWVFHSLFSLKTPIAWRSASRRRRRSSNDLERFTLKFSKQSRRDQKALDDDDENRTASEELFRSLPELRYRYYVINAAVLFLAILTIQALILERYKERLKSMTRIEFFWLGILCTRLS